MPPQKSEPDEKLAQITRARRIKDQKDLEAATGLVDTGRISSLPGASLERQTADGRFKRKMDDRTALFISYVILNSIYTWRICVGNTDFPSHYLRVIVGYRERWYQSD